jgi:uncharacterized protein
VNELDRARYISLTTFKMDGSPVSSAVWITGKDGAYAFTTGGTAWKAKRLRRNPAVEVHACDLRGRVKPGATRYVGTGQVASSADALAAAERALAAKYGWQFRATKVLDRLHGAFGRADPQTVVAIRLVLAEA